jgi:hypothetical protein
MSNKLNLSAADKNKILNCQDELQSTLAGLVKATKSFQEASDKLEKRSASGLSGRGSNYYQKMQDKKALDAANATIDKITKDYTVDISSIKKNIGVLTSQEIYQRRIKDLIKYYKQNISSDQKKIAEEKGKRSIANRMSTFYNDKSETSKTVKNYTSYLYWGIFIIALILLIYNGVRGGVSMAAITSIFTSTVDTAKQAVKKLNKKVNKKVKNPLSKKQEAQVTGGPSNINRASKVLATPKKSSVAFAKAKEANKNRSTLVGGMKYSLYPWLGIVVVFALLPITIEYIFKPLQPYFIELTLPKVGN